MKTISISLYNRPQYTEKMFDALKQCQHIKDYYIFISIDTSEAETQNELDVIKLAQKSNLSNKKIIIQKKRLDCATNVYTAIKMAFNAGSEYNIHIEDDIIVCKDTLLYFEWANKQYFKDKKVFCITSYNKRGTQPSLTEFNKVLRSAGFNSWGWAIWIDRWKQIENNWDFCYKDMGWDYHLLHHMQNKNLVKIAPLVSRVQNIGAENGRHVPSREWHAKNHYNKIWVGNYDNITNEFLEVK